MNIISAFLARVSRLMQDRDDESALLDHLPISGNFKFKKKRAQAIETHGKTLRTDVTCPRETPRSVALLEFDAKASKRKNPSSSNFRVIAAKKQ